jgi:hypothetical protein
MTRNKSARLLTSFCVLLVSSFPCACQRTSKTPEKSQTKAQAKSPAQIQWLHYNDSAEGAFNMDVPLGWQVKGGMYRFGYFDVRWMMGVRSLDGKVVIRINDIDVPPYALPGPTTGREGQPYIRPQQYQMVVERFQQAQPYAETYAKHAFSSLCKTMTPSASAWSPTLPPGWIDAKHPSSSGAVAYSCATTDGPRILNVYTFNSLIQGQGYGFWIATPISILCSPNRCAQAQSMTQHMIDSWQKNPQWVQYQNQLTQIGLEHIRQGFQQFMQQMQQIHERFTQSLNRQQAGFYAHMHSEEQQFSSWDDVINNETNVTDPDTGTQFKVFTGPKHNYYENGLGVKINSDVSPGPDFHQLQVNP